MNAFTLFVRLAWVVPALPLLGFLINGLLGRRMSRELIRAVGCAAVVGSFVFALPASWAVLSGSLDEAALAQAGIRADAGARTVELELWDWIPAGEREGQAPDGSRFSSRLQVPFGIYLDALSAVMLLVVTGVGSLIHVYAAEYMWDEEGYWRFFTYLNLFVSMMLVLIMGSSFLTMFVGWEGVGLCSYLLIGFYYKQGFPPVAGMKAFLVNRIGDFGFLLGLLLMLLTFGSLRYSDVLPRMARAASFDGSALATAIALLLFVGAVGKSAQVPLHVWLPDAMAGPTPVSALIHAATMVTAGVYLVIRGNVLFQSSVTASTVVAVIGALTALMAATIALVQVDIKKILAYSTVSQLGYMFLAVGVGAYAAGLFHLVTHAFFKALLFLGAGSVSHGMSGELDVRKMGGLSEVMPHTRRVMLVATLAIAGIPPLAGFWSKDEILAGVAASTALGGMRWLLWLAGVVTALLTAFYMFRLYFLTFSGTQRWPEGVHPHESKPLMLVPLYVLAVLSAFGGLLGLGAWTHLPNGMHAALESVVRHGTLVAGMHHLSLAVELALLVVALGMAVGGALWARSWYAAETEAPAKLAASHPRMQRLLFGKYHLDEVYEALVVAPVRRLARWSGAWDRWVVDGLVEATGIGALLTGEIFRHMSSGRVRTYTLAVFLGGVGLACWLWFQWGTAT